MKRACLENHFARFYFKLFWTRMYLIFYKMSLSRIFKLLVKLTEVMVPLQSVEYFFFWMLWMKTKKSYRLVHLMVDSTSVRVPGSNNNSNLNCSFPLSASQEMRIYEIKGFIVFQWRVLFLRRVIYMQCSLRNGLKSLHIFSAKVSSKGDTSPRKIPCWLWRGDNTRKEWGKRANLCRGELSQYC